MQTQIHDLYRFGIFNITQKLSIDSEEADAALVITHNDVAFTIQRQQLGAVIHGGAWWAVQ